jgi:hypothetical protein
MHMQKVATSPTPVKRYAVYYADDGTAIYGQAELLRGYGYLFRSDDGTWMVPLTTQDLTSGKADLFGWAEVADQQLAADLAKREAEAQARRCDTCGMIGCRGDATCGAEQVLEKLAAVMDT